MNATQQSSSTITVVQSLPDLEFPAYTKTKTKEGHSPIVLPGIQRAGMAFDLGTPNLGTAWQVDSISVYYEKLEAQRFDSTPGGEDSFLYFITYLFMGSSEIFREASEKIQFPLTGAKVEEFLGKLFESSFVALQNLAQTLVVPGGQQLSLEVSVFEKKGGTGVHHIIGELTQGKVTMNYTRIGP